jgi:hypothetical protein
MNIRRSVNTFFALLVSTLCLLLSSTAPLFSQTADNEITIWPEPGSYASDIQVSFPVAGEELSYRLEISETSHEGFQAYKGSFLLSALPGEERSYTLLLEGGEKFLFLIDKNPPPAPLLLKNGEDRLNLSPTEEGSKTFFRQYPSDSKSPPPFQLWKKDDLLLQHRQSAITKVEAYSMDEAGNRSDITVRYFEKPYSADSDIPILSPVSGIFLNPQLFYIDTQGYQWIRYTIDGSDPVIMGASYQEPLLIRTRGLTKIEVAALPIGSEEPVRSEVVFAQYPEGDSLLPASGIYSNALAFELPDAIERFSTVESAPPTRINRGSLTIKGLDGALSLHPLRFYPPEDRQNREQSSSPEQELPGYTPEYRFFYVMDNRRPASPRMSLNKSLPFSNPMEISLEAGEDETIYYTLNGTSPDRYALKYRRPFLVDPNEWGEQGAVELRAIAYSKTGVSGRERRELLSYDTIPPGEPVVEINKIDEEVYQIRATLQEGEDSSRIHYTISFGEEGGIPDGSSPLIDSPLLFSLPRGSADTAYLTFITLDAAGNRSDPPVRKSISWDLLAPPDAELAVSENRLAFSTREGTVEYKLSSLLLASDEKMYGTEQVADNNSAASDTPSDGGLALEKDVWSSYASPIELNGEEGKLYEYRITYRSVDDSGNISSPKKGGPWLIDKRTRFQYTIFGLPEKSVSHDLILSFQHDLLTKVHLKLIREEIGSDQEPTILYNGQWEKQLLIEAETGKDYLYNLELYPYSAVTGTKGNLFEKSFRIDKKAPFFSLPESITTLYLNQKSSIRLSDLGVEHDNDELDQIWSMIIPEDKKRSASGSTPTKKSFYLHGRLLHPDGEIESTFSSGDGKYDLYFMVQDPRGNSTITTEPVNLLYDTTAPAPPSFRVEEKGASSEPWTLYPVPDDEDPVLTLLDGKGSPLKLDQPIYVEEGDSLSFYHMDRAGNRSAPVVYTPAGRALFKNGVLLASADADGEDGGSDLSFEDDPAPASGDTPTTPLVEGIPRYFWSGEDIRISPLNGKGTLRYELALGCEAGSVSSGSDILDEPINITAEEGEAFYVSLALALYERLGGEDKVLIRERYRFGIDRNAPIPPSVLGVEDSSYYRDDRTIRLFHEEPEVQSIRYRIIQGSQSDESSNQTNFLTYTDPIKIASRKGSFTNYALESYAVDEAGNRSDLVRYNFAIDKAVLYVASPTSGDAGDTVEARDGSRGKPYHSLEKALAEAQKGGMSTIILSTGEHQLSNPLLINEGELILKGGYTSLDWSRTEKLTALVSNNSFGKKPLFTLLGGSLALEQVSIDNLTSGGAILHQQGGQVRMKDVDIYQASGEVPVALSVSNGNLHFSDGTIRFGPLTKGVLIGIENGKGSFVSSTITGTSRSQDSTLIDVRRGNLSLDQTLVKPGAGNKITSLKLFESSLSLVNSFVRASDDDSRSTAVSLDNSDAYVLSSSLISGSRGRITFLLEAKQSILNMEKSLLLAGESDGTVQVSLENSSLTGNEMVFTAQNSRSSFLYGIQSSGSTIDLSRSIFFHKSGGDIITVDLKKSTLNLKESSFGIDPSGSAPLLQLLKSDGSSKLTATSSLFYRGPSVSFPRLFSDPSRLTSLQKRGNNSFLSLPEPLSASAVQEDRKLFDLWTYGSDGTETSSQHPVMEYPELYQMILMVDPVR